MPRIVPPGRARGFTLIEIAVVIAILAIFIAMAASLTRGLTAGQKRSTTATRIATVDAALAQFVTQNKRLPCPANGTLASADVNAGVEGGRLAATGCTGNQQNGVVPWRALGIAEIDATDGWDRRLTYRVFPLLAADNMMDITKCDPAGTAAVAAGGACVTPCSTAVTCTSPSNFLNSKGLKVRNLAGVLLMDPTVAPFIGAAYVVVSHGESGGGGYLNSGVLGASSVGDGTEEMKNYASAQYVPATSYYVDDGIADAAGVNHFDDIVSRPTIMGVAAKAGLGPRPQS